MRVALVDSHVAFFHGGAELLMSKLADAFRALGHDVETVRVPFNPAGPESIERALDFCLHEDLTRWIARPDVIVPLRFPAYLVSHPNKRVWLLHQLRQYYEFYGETAKAGNAEHCARVRSRIVESDSQALSGAQRLWTLSSRVSARLLANNGVSAPALHSPLPVEACFYQGRQERYIFAPSRMEKPKRQWLLIEAMRYVRSDVKAVIGGDGGAYGEYARLIETLGLQDRVLLTPRMSQEVMASWYANCLSVFFAPFDEDYGYISLEAMVSAKPVITCVDSGGTLDFVKDHSTGFVVEPEPKAIAEVIDRLAAKPALARSLGDAGRDSYDGLGLTWERTAQTLLD